MKTPSDEDESTIEQESPKPRISQADTLRDWTSMSSPENNGAWKESQTPSVAADTPPGAEDDGAPKPATLLPRSLTDDTITEANLNDEGMQETKTQPTNDPNYPRWEKLAQKNPSPLDNLSLTLGGPAIILFDIVVPCIIYYVWYNVNKSHWERDCQIYTTRNPGQQCPIQKPEYDKDIMGYAIITFGFGELYILIARVARLLLHRDECAPLLSRSKWELDATSWVYLVAMLMALIPFVVGSSLVIPELYLYGPSFLMAFLGTLMLLTLIPIPLPIGINSQPRGTKLRPFIYYAAEDFIAIDGCQDREFRIRFNRRYNASKAFRNMFVHLTLWWVLGICVYIGCVSAVIWTLEFHYAFGLSLGILFSYIAIWAATSYFWVDFAMKRENRQLRRQLSKV